MTVKAAYSTPLLHVSDVQRSLDFYGLLGFEIVDIEKSNGTIGWARMHCEGGALMFVLAEQSHSHHHDRFLLYLYTPDLPTLCRELEASGITVGPISHPEYMPSGEICLTDPDGYTVLIGHWGEKEHTTWLQQLESKRKAGLIP